VSRVRAPHTGLDALRAAVADVRQEELARSARAARVAGGAGGHRPAGQRAVTRPRLMTGGRDEVVLPAPASAGDDASGGPAAASPATAAAPTDVPSAELEDAPAPPEGDVAVSLALVHRAQAGDADAFGELYDRYVDLVYRYVYYRVGTPQVAEDLTSETFLRALRRITSFTWQGRDVGAWFVTIARNLIADHYKSSRYRLEVTTDDVALSGAPPVTEGPEREVLDGLQNEVLLGAVKDLGSEQQECVVLRFLHGLSVAETARAMGKNEGAIKALQYRAVRALGRLLPEGLEL